MSKRFHERKDNDNSQQDKPRPTRPGPRPAGPRPTQPYHESDELPLPERDELKGKKCSALHPGRIQPVDPKVAVLLGLSFPIALLVFWKITLPFLASSCSLIIGADIVQTVVFIKEDIVNAITSPCPNWLGAEERAFIKDSSPKPIRRVSNLTFTEFEHIVNTGEPIVVSDGMKDWPGLGLLSCQSFISKYPDAEYFDWQGQVSIALKDINKRKHYKDLECTAGYMDVQTPANARYIQDWVNQVRAPYFLSEDIYTLEPFAKASHPNMNFFIGTQHTGVSPHLDETCDTFITAQFSGVKNWSLSWPIKEQGELKWSKPIVFTLYPGELLFWYVGMRHHTEVLEGCSLSFSFQITTPAPRDYFHKLTQTINSVPETDREKLFKQTYTSNSHFLDSCNIIEKDGKSFITASLKPAS